MRLTVFVSGMFLFLVGKDVVAGLVTAVAGSFFMAICNELENSNDMIEVL